MFTTATRVLVITFDRALQDRALDSANWFLRVGDLRYTIAAAQASANTAVLTGGLSVADVGPDVVSYSPPPFDVASTEGAVADAFSDFPVVVPLMPNA